LLYRYSIAGAVWCRIAANYRLAVPAERIPQMNMKLLIGLLALGVIMLATGLVLMFFGVP